MSQHPSRSAHRIIKLNLILVIVCIFAVSGPALAQSTDSTSASIKQPSKKQVSAPLPLPENIVPGEIIVKFKVVDDQDAGLRFSPVQTYRGGNRIAVKESNPFHVTLDSVLMDPTLGIQVSEGRKAFVHITDTGDLSRDRAIEQRKYNALIRSAALRRSVVPTDEPVNLSSIYVFSCREGQEEAAVAALSELPQVEYAQVNYLIEPSDLRLPDVSYIPNDPFIADESETQWRAGSWGQLYEGEPYPDLWGLKQIQLLEALNLFSNPITRPGAGIVVAVVDTGVGYHHPDLAPNLWTHGDIPGDANHDGCPGTCGVDDDGDGLVDEDSRNFEPGDPFYDNDLVMDDDENGFIDDTYGYDFGNDDNDPMDTEGHGTHVAGTIAAVANNGIGILGIAPNAKIMSIKGFPNSPALGTTESLANGLRYAGDNHADVINNSWACAWGCPSNPIMEDVAQYVHSLGSLMVFAAGNENRNVVHYSPQNMAETFTVGAVDIMDQRSDFSNFGMLVDVFAPGGGPHTQSPALFPHYNILSLYIPDSDYVDYYPYLIVDEHTMRLSGTSMASPHVAGLAALALSAYPYFNQDDIRRLIQDSADKMTFRIQPPLFGNAIAASGNHLVIGSEEGEWAGTASFYQWIDGMGWTYKSTLPIDDRLIGSRYGTVIAISDDHIVMGARDYDIGDHWSQGTVFVLQINQDMEVIERTQLWSSDGDPYDQFGNAVAASSNRIAVGAWRHSGTGAAYVFSRNGNAWIEQAIISDDIAPGDGFGIAIALSGDMLAVGAPEDDDGGNSSGSVYLFHFDGNTWVQQAKLTASDPSAEDRFGSALALFENTLAVGAPYEDAQDSNAGAVYIYEYNTDNGWSQMAKLTADDGQADDFLGSTLALNEDTLLIGASGIYLYGTATESAYVFKQTDSGWIQQSKLTASDGGSRDFFGTSVALASDTALIGAPYAGGGFDPYSGAVYVFQPASPNWLESDKLVLTEHHHESGRLNALKTVTQASKLVCELPVLDCNHNGLDDWCELLDGSASDCNHNRIPDACDVSSGNTLDNFPTGGDGIPDTCQADCNMNGLPDDQEIRNEVSRDLNRNNVPDTCEPTFRVPRTHPTIQSAVDAAPSGSFVVISAGHYSGTGNQDVTVRDKQLFIVGEQGPARTIVDCQNSSRGFTIESSPETQGSLIHGITIQNGRTDTAGGAIALHADSVRISNCIFKNNKADQGGAVSMEGNHVHIENSLIVQNSATTSGGGIHASSGSALLRNCTVANNNALTGGGAYFQAGEHRIANTIAWNNTAKSGAQFGLNAAPVSLSISYSDVQSGESGIYREPGDNATIHWDEGNLASNPRFVSPWYPGGFSKVDYHLRHDSPCIDAGNPAFLPSPGETDVDGDLRLRNQRVDMGSDETRSTEPGSAQQPVGEMPSSPCDVNGDGHVDKLDIEMIQSCLVSPDPDRCQAADLDQDGEITKLDLERLQQCVD